MPSFFTSHPRKPSPIFAGLDDPFNFPTTKMRYSSIQRTSSPDSGYGSIDDSSSPLSPESFPQAQAHISKRRLAKDAKGHWRMHSYEYQSTNNDRVAEIQPILSSTTRAPDNEHRWLADPEQTFEGICGKGEGWLVRRVYGRALKRRERCEGISVLQREMAPVLRRAEADVGVVDGGVEQRVRVQVQVVDKRPVQPRKKSTLLHPSSPVEMGSQSQPASSASAFASAEAASAPHPRGHRMLYTLLHPSVPLPQPQPHPQSDSQSHSPSPSRTPSPSPLPQQHKKHQNQNHTPLKPPRLRAQTPLRIPLSSAGQPAPSPPRLVSRSPSPSPSPSSSLSGSQSWERSWGRRQSRGRGGGRSANASASQTRGRPRERAAARDWHEDGSRGREGSVLHSCFSDDEDDNMDQNKLSDPRLDSASTSTSTSTWPCISRTASTSTAIVQDAQDAQTKRAREPGHWLVTENWSRYVLHNKDDIVKDVDIKDGKDGDMDMDVDTNMDMWSLSSARDGLGMGVVLARTGRVARAQRVRVGAKRVRA